MRKKYDMIWVHPEFKRALKTKANLSNKSIIDFTKDFACVLEESNLEELTNEKKKKKHPFM